MSKKKKIIIMSSLVFLLALTAVLNVLLATKRNRFGRFKRYNHVQLLYNLPHGKNYHEKRRAFAA